MATSSRDELSKTDFLKLADSSTGKISKVISPNPLQVGLDDDQFRSSLIVKGGITGSITQVSDGVDFLQAGSNVTVTKNSNGSLTIAASIVGSGEPLTLGNSFEYNGGATEFDGTVAQQLKLNFVNKGGLDTVSSAGVRINFDNLNTDVPEEDDYILFGEEDNATPYFPKRATIANLATLINSLGSPVTVSNAITFGPGIEDTSGGATSWNNSSAVTLGVDLKGTDSGLNFAGGKLQVDPTQATATTVIDLANDFALIYDASAGATRKVALQYVAGVAPNGLTLGAGLQDGSGNTGTVYDGASAQTVKVRPADSTINVSVTGVAVQRVPNQLSDGAGIQTLAFDGSSTTTVAVDRNTAGGLNFDGSNKLQLDVNNLSAAGTPPALTDEIAVAYGANDTQKVDIGAIKNLILNNIVSNTVWVDQNVKAFTTSSISIDSAGGNAESHGTDVFFFVSGSVGNDSSPNANKSVFGGDVHATVSIISQAGFSGSLTTLQDGSPYLVAGSNITLSTSSAGAITISSTGGGGGGSSVTFVSGSTSVGSVTSVNTSKLGKIQDLTGGSIAITGSIGDAEDGTYSDGLFTDFTTTTPVGTAVDRFNEVLKGLAPSAAPTLDDMDCADSGQAAKLSFGSSQSVSGYTNVQPSTLTPASSLSDVDINSSYQVQSAGNDLRRACFTGTTTINGSLNADVAADGVNYPAAAIGNGDQGTLKLYVNNNSTEAHSVDLTVFTSGDSLNGDGTGFLELSVADPGHFADGTNFDTFKHRTGSFVVAPATQVNGWNYARVVHEIGSSTTTTNYVEWVNDSVGSGVALTSAGSALDTLSMTGLRLLSGARYFTAGTAEYRIRSENAYRNVYPTTDITFDGTRCSVPAQSFPAIDHAAGEDETKVLHITGSATINTDPILNNSISVAANIPAVLKSGLTSVGSQSINGILLYNLSNTSTVTSESFRAENYRLISGSYDAQADVTDAANAWDSTLHMSGTNAGHEDGLLFYNSRMYAPAQGAVSGDFRNTADGGSILNGPNNNVNYSNITTGMRTFYRYFQNNSGGSKTDFQLTINGSGTIASQPTTLNTSNIHVLLKIPTTSDPFSTGWMDLALDFNTGQNGNGAGCLNGALDSSLNATNTGTFGTQSVGSNEYIMVKIEADASWTGYISSMSITWV